MVVTTASDADSSGDSKVIAQSVNGEDDLVDVTMKDVEPGLPSKPNSPTA
jgi:ubiquitin carboxyl-terminal hydrolase 4/11